MAAAYAKTLEEDAEIISEQVVKIKKALKSLTHVDEVADSMLRSVFPDTTQTLRSTSSLLFIILFISVSCCCFGFLFNYFYTKNCTVRTGVVPLFVDPIYYKDTFHSGDRRFCSAKTKQIIGADEGIIFTYPPEGNMYGSSTKWCTIDTIPCNEYGALRGVNDLCPSKEYDLLEGAMQPLQPGVAPSCIDGKEFYVYNNTYSGGQIIVEEVPSCYSDSYVEGPKEISIDYLECESTITCVLNAMQYTGIAQIVTAVLFLFVRKLILSKGRAALQAATYTDLIENKVPKRELLSVVFSKTNDVVPDDQSVSDPEVSKEKVAIKNEENTENSVLEKIALFVIKQVAPRSQYTSRGSLSSAIFLLWFVGASCALFVCLMYYQLVGLCTEDYVLTTTAGDENLYRQAFTGGGKTICSSQVMLPKAYDANYTLIEPIRHDSDVSESFTAYCLLPGLTCKDYGSSLNIERCSSGCNETFKCEESSFSDVLVTFVQCTPVEEALMQSIQFTLFGQTLFLGIYFLIALIKQKGLIVLISLKSYTDLWQNIKPEDDEEEGEEEVGEVKDEKENGQQKVEETSKPEEAANFVLHTVAPLTVLNIRGSVSSYTFLLFYLTSVGATFGLLLSYFLKSNCSKVMTIVDNRLGAAQFQDLFAAGNNYICTARQPFNPPNYPLGYEDWYDAVAPFLNDRSYKFECLLNGFTPETYASHPMCEPTVLSKAASQVDCNDDDDKYYVSYLLGSSDCEQGRWGLPFYKIRDNNAWKSNVPNFEQVPVDSVSDSPYCYQTFSSGGYPSFVKDNGPTSLVEYISCSDPLTTLALAAQYTVYVSFTVLVLYFLGQVVYYKGVSALFRRSTYDILLSEFA